MKQLVENAHEALELAETPDTASESKTQRGTALHRSMARSAIEQHLSDPRITLAEWRRVFVPILQGQYNSLHGQTELMSDLLESIEEGACTDKPEEAQGLSSSTNKPAMETTSKSILIYM
jgi:hypothetical protein